MEQIGELDFASPIGFMKVKDFLPQVLEEVTQDYSTQYAILKKSMETNGQLVPLHVSRDMLRLRDGIHRIALATKLGWKFMDVSTDRRSNDAWDISDAGKEYWRLWHWRLRGFKNG